MADNNEIKTKKEISATSKSTSTENTRHKKNSANNLSTQKHSALKPTTILSLAAIIIAVLALIEGFYSSSKTQNVNTAEVKATVALNATINDQKQKITELNQQLSQLKAAIDKSAAQIGDNTASIQTLKEAKDLSDNRWVLVDVKHLLNTANYYLVLAPAPNTALAILEKANKQLASLNDSKTLKLQQLITNVVTQLKALPQVDYASSLMQLNSISEQLAQLPLVNDSAEGEVQKLSTTSESKSGWHKYWHKSLEALEKLVIIRHQDQTIEPLISPKQQMFLVENIQLKLSQASWALLQNNQKVFEDSLSAAITWINKYYAPDATATTSVISSLKALKNINLQPKLPDLNTAIDLNSELLKAESTAGAKS